MQLNLNHLKSTDLQTFGRVCDDNNQLLCLSREHTPNVLAEGIYQLNIVVDGRQHKPHLAIVSCDNEPSQVPYVIAFVEPGRECHSKSVIIAPADYERLRLAVQTCHDRHETVTLFISNRYI